MEARSFGALTPYPPPPPPQVAWTLQTLSANALELSGLWERSGFGAALLVDVDKPAFTLQLPMQVSGVGRGRVGCGVGWEEGPPPSAVAYHQGPRRLSASVLLSGTMCRANSYTAPSPLPERCIPGLPD